MRELKMEELDHVSGAGWTEAGAALAGVGAIGAATFGGSGVAWGAVGVAAAWAIAPIAVVAIGGLSLYAGICLTTQ